MAAYMQRAVAAESEMERIGREATKIMSHLSARCIILEAAMAVILKHNLLDDLVAEQARLSAPTAVPASPDTERKGG